MKFASIIFASLIATVMTATCDPTKISYKYYTDDKCATLNKEATKTYGKPSKEQYALYEPGCHFEPKYEISYTLDCEAKGLLQSVYKGKQCKTPMEKFGKTLYKWGKCQNVSGSNVYMVVTTE